MDERNVKIVKLRTRIKRVKKRLWLSPQTRSTSAIIFFFFFLIPTIIFTRCKVTDVLIKLAETSFFEFLSVNKVSHAFAIIISAIYLHPDCSSKNIWIKV